VLKLLPFWCGATCADLGPEGFVTFALDHIDACGAGFFSLRFIFRTLVWFNRLRHSLPDGNS